VKSFYFIIIRAKCAMCKGQAVDIMAKYVKKLKLSV
jgi:hypothetical protein